MTISRIPSVEGGIQPTLLTAKGDLISATAASTVARLAVGSDAQILVADSSVSVGMKWAAASTPAFVGCRVYKAAPLALANATNTAFPFDTESFDTNSFHDNATNNTRVTIPTGYGGKYSINFVSYIEGTGTYAVITRLYVNGASTDYQQDNKNSGEYQTCRLNSVRSLSAGDYIEVYVYQASGVSKNFYSDNTYGFLSVQFLGA
jgi:hypothetical protein